MNLLLRWWAEPGGWAGLESGAGLDMGWIFPWELGWAGWAVGDWAGQGWERLSLHFDSLNASDVHYKT